MMLVDGLPGLQAVAELSDCPVEQVPLCLGMPVSGFSPTAVVRVRPGDRPQGREGPTVERPDHGLAWNHLLANQDMQ